MVDDQKKSQEKYIRFCPKCSFVITPSDLTGGSRNKCPICKTYLYEIGYSHIYKDGKLVSKEEYYSDLDEICIAVESLDEFKKTFEKGMALLKK